ncbi:protein translocase subunit SecF [Geomonas subterranea]|uniref:Protein-export membrane protein SecF n=1 Tax=Geomonas subterranea TaxID=2847989 RepID=A0ABX8LJM1_9BACT|nr:MULTISPECIES: protein translocase subunit SecF [Geomonas]QXE91892.1 protein translocase subunit SecF [Geomonas subterranea]QXM11573.1 protein translocase subunit SecF [Geomonas subterranea]
MQIISNTQIDFIGKRTLSFAVSALITIIGLFGALQIATNRANMGIDFSGGTSVQVAFTRPVQQDKVHKALSAELHKEVNLQEISGGNRLLIKVGKSGTDSLNVADSITGRLRAEFPDNAFVVESSNEVGPSIGDKLKKDTLQAVALSMVGIVFYIAWRFDFNFGIGAVAATLHDVLAMIALFYLLDKEVNLLFITAILTIAGYSLTDTVVIFDRIRENLNKSVLEAKGELFNRSINEVLPRTIITSLTTFLAAISLYLFGGEAIGDFALALVAGIVIATYSSIFIASPIVLQLERRDEAKRQARAETAGAPESDGDQRRT